MKIGNVRMNIAVEASLIHISTINAPLTQSQVACMWISSCSFSRGSCGVGVVHAVDWCELLRLVWTEICGELALREEIRRVPLRGWQVRALYFNLEAGGTWDSNCSYSDSHGSRAKELTMEAERFAII